MADFSILTNQISQWVINPLIWLVIIAVALGATVGLLLLMKHKKLKFPAMEIVNLGDGRTAINHFKVGWFGKRAMLFGLIHRGEEVLKNKHGEVILNFSTEDYQEIDGRRGVICFRDPKRQNMLVPISAMQIANTHLIAEIAPAQYTDTAIEIVNEATKETRDWKQQLYMWLAIGGVVIFALVAIIVITQMVKNGQKDAADLIVKAGTVCSDNCRTICSTIAATSNAP